jgi:hypothetical protein
MVNWLYIAIPIGLFIISLFFETMRDIYGEAIGFITDIIEDIFGDFGEGLIYVITFEWVGDIPDFFGSMFEDITEFSIYGIAFGLVGLILIFYLRSYTIEPFVQYYSGLAKTFWTIATYGGVFIGGYLMGKFFENTA